MINKREQRIGIVAAVVLGALAMDRVVLSPLLARQDAASTRISAAQLALNDATQTLQNDQRAAQLWNKLAGKTLLASAPDTEGQLLNRARQWADTSRLALQSLKPERSEREQGYQKITIRATATGSMQQVARFLDEVRNASIPVTVADLSLTARKEHTDELSAVIALSTIYLPPQTTTEAGR